MSVDHALVQQRTFAELGLPAALVRALGRAKISTPTPVQAVVIPDAMAGRDVLGRAATGSGKTLAFGLPILTRLAGSRSRPKSPRALIVVPTRELAGQVRSSLEPIADAVGLKVATVYGGTPYDRQIKRLRAGVDLVVATPGRLQDLINRGACRLDRIEITVLDEADHLCDLGFFPAVSELVALTPAAGQRLLLSATLDGDVDRLVRTHLTNPVTHDCDPEGDIPDMEHHVLVTGPHNKLESTAALLRANPRSIVFTRTRHGATNLAHDLAGLGVTTVDLHGSLTQNARERNLRTFRSGKADVVVATDVAARGIHVDGVSLVVHYDAPTERKSYLHRSGRTARAGSSGAVVTMTTARHVSAVTRLQKAAGVTALHHDARTAPQPMTAESLALHGVVPAQADPTSSPARSTSTRHTYNG
ncbi:MAG: DEAD/DEAH box helicase, partial [Propionibacteriales bacterium]|nr:DEAD/DEAH box helicase [Propionibacteriales bacterium]